MEFKEEKFFCKFLCLTPNNTNVFQLLPLPSTLFFISIKFLSKLYPCFLLLAFIFSQLVFFICGTFIQLVGFRCRILWIALHCIISFLPFFTFHPHTFFLWYITGCPLIVIVFDTVNFWFQVFYRKIGIFMIYWFYFRCYFVVNWGFSDGFCIYW